MSTEMTSRITVDRVLSQWEKEYKIALGIEARDTLLLLFTEILDKVVDITVEETIKSNDLVPRITH